MKAVAPVAVALALALPGPAPAAIRAVFVGIDHYRYSEAAVADAQFGDLRGAVGDVGRIKAALRKAYDLDVDTPDPRGCRSANSVSVTLTDGCATRQAILDALGERIAASRPGDSLIFYYAGHGSQVIDDEVFDQASGNNDSILAADARQPGALTAGDILDRELRALIDRATDAGVNVVTIFDSCHSGTATRGAPVAAGAGEARSAPVLLVSHAPRPAGPTAAPAGAMVVYRPPAGPRAAEAGTGRRPPARAADAGRPAGGYRVHFAAARDGELARERPLGDGRAGVFTLALAEALVALPHATFDDIAAEVELKVAERGVAGQHPQAEGALRASLGGEDRRTPLLAAEPAPGGASLAAGRLSGVTEGSRFALFASSTAALAPDGASLASGRVSQVQPDSALIVIDEPLATPLPGRMVARETLHAFGADQLRLRSQLSTAAGRNGLADALKVAPFARVGEPAQVLLAAGFNDALPSLSTVEGVRIADLPDPRAPGFARALRDLLEAYQRVQALLALRTDPAKVDSKVCIASGDYDAYACPTPAGSEAHLMTRQSAKLTVTNTSSEPRFIYVFAVDPDLAVTLLIPPNGGRDPPVAAHTPLGRLFTPQAPGAYRFLTLTTDAAIDAAALEQAGASRATSASCHTGLGAYVCAASRGRQDTPAHRVTTWTAAISTAVVDPAGAARAN